MRAFHVGIDGRRAARTSILRGDDLDYLDMPIPAGSRSIRLVAGDAGDGINGDRANSCNAGFFGQ